MWTLSSPWSWLYRLHTEGFSDQLTLYRLFSYKAYTDTIQVGCVGSIGLRIVGESVSSGPINVLVTW